MEPPSRHASTIFAKCVKSTKVEQSSVLLAACITSMCSSAVTSGQRLARFFAPGRLHSRLQATKTITLIWLCLLEDLLLLPQLMTPKLPRAQRCYPTQCRWVWAVALRRRALAVPTHLHPQITACCQHSWRLPLLAVCSRRSWVVGRAQVSEICMLSCARVVTKTLSQTTRLQRRRRLTICFILLRMPRAPFWNSRLWSFTNTVIASLDSATLLDGWLVSRWDRQTFVPCAALYSWDLQRPYSKIHKYLACSL
mmetsp:Transcript_8946/g.14216  ORF Transcript_8946/g.14216 Transcript_8946/m.14216 type:complete len:253 (+) Transcript_8946:695-1453(+)